jgi:signal transduction histidine kinase
MKNSLHIFMAQLDILKRYSSAEETDPAKINKVVDGMGKTLDQMVGLTGAVGRFSSGAKTSSENCCDVISVVTNCMKIYEARMKKLGINKTVKIPEVHLSGMISEFELTQVIFNLLENAAFKAKMIRGLEISLELKFDDQFARVIIEDNGDPIPKDIRDKIFTPYFTTKGSDGSGQGLYICRKKLQDNGGDITLLHSAETTAFEVKIPLL